MTFEMTLSEGDLDPVRASVAKRIAEGGEVMSETPGELQDQRLRSALFDALPTALAKRFARITPGDYVVAELTLKVLVKGSPFGIGVEGEALVKFVPAPRDLRGAVEKKKSP